ncbi:MAG: Gfo/Idh/MocA family oxidoreductase [Vampirovibrionales bacterium]|nr:Gfo/Idh/MocA family oxidoreductase [Vampirovibrionales bacterium]
MTLSSMTPTPYASNFDAPLRERTPHVAVIGCGRWGRNLARNFHYLEALGALCDLDKEHLLAVGKAYEGIPLTSRPDKIFQNPDIDAVVIATPSHSHFALASAALQAGKHVYVEKPMAIRRDDAQALCELADQTDRILMVGHLLLYHPAVTRLRQLIEEGFLGEIRYIQSDRLNINPWRQDVSVLWDLAPHDLSMMAYLLGAQPDRIISAQGHRTSPDQRIDVAHLELAFPGGADGRPIGGHIHVSWIHPHKHVKLIVRGSERTAVLDDTLESGKLQIFRKEDDPIPVREFADYLAIEPLKLECQHFLNCVRDNHPPRTDAADGCAIVGLLEAAHALI